MRNVYEVLNDTSEERAHPEFETILRELLELHRKKNSDYRGEGHGPLGSFKRISTIMKLYPNVVWTDSHMVMLVYMLKQLDAVFALEGREAQAEGRRERLRDVAVYAILGMLHE